MTRRVLFTLSMPGRASVGGRWSLEACAFNQVRRIAAGRCSELLTRGHGTWTYSFGDGWVAQVAGRVMEVGERAPHSDGFAGYGWMIDSIVAEGVIKP